MSKIVIFTDGSSRGNPGPGGWGVVILNLKDQISRLRQGSGGQANLEDESQIAELGGREDRTTNNRMELMAAIKGLLHTPEDSEATIYTDSSYLINGITKWVHGWKRNGWKTKTKEDVLNKDLWMKLDDAASGHKITWKQVAGHVGSVGNERCDEIATGFADNKEVNLFNGDFSDYSIRNILDISHDAGKMAAKKSDSSRSKMKAYSYISAINGEVKIHHTWADCEKRVKGVKGARFKKAISADEEAAIIKEFKK